MVGYDLSWTCSSDLFDSSFALHIFGESGEGSRELSGVLVSESGTKPAAVLEKLEILVKVSGKEE
jgi:hypothetical protein